tara:strand:+ start:348 stop:731 length:384 start_codon:yes stop_codon:yes gene_type:complete
MKRIRIALLFFVMGMVGSLGAAPTENIVIEETAPASLKNIHWHERDGGWLFTCRFKVPSDNVILPVSHLEFTGFVVVEDEREVIWTKTKTILRSKLDRDELFVRVMIVDFPKEAEGMEIRFVNGPHS